LFWVSNIVYCLLSIPSVYRCYQKVQNNNRTVTFYYHKSNLRAINDVCIKISRLSEEQTPWRRFLLENLIVAHLVQKFLAFMELESSPLYSQKSD